jgi:hypothetical protein
MIFRKRVPTTAREALRDPVFPPRADLRVDLVVDYDAARWVRCPVRGEDRTTWRDAVLDAFAADLGWSTGRREAEVMGRVLDGTADSPLDDDATFLLFDLGHDTATVLTLDLADEEVTLLEHGNPETFLTFGDLDIGQPARVETFPGGVRYATRHGVDEAGRPVVHLRVHRLLTPELHLVGIAFGQRGEHVGDALALCAAAEARPRGLAAG